MNSPEYWDTLFRERDTFHKHMLGLDYWKDHEVVLRMSEIDIQGSVIDIGCGTGELTTIIAAEHTDTTFYGIDISPYAIDVANRRQQVNCRWTVGIAEKLPYEDSTFDLGISSHCLEHIEELDPVFQEITRVMKAGSIFYTFVPLNGAYHHKSDKHKWNEEEFISEFNKWAPTTIISTRAQQIFAKTTL